MNHPQKALATYGTVGLELAVGVALGMYGGKYLDDRWGTSPLCLLLGLALGVTTGVRAMLRAARQMARDAEEEAKQNDRRRPRFDDEP